jgi:ABC-type xylose transport system permease subunit
MIKIRRIGVLSSGKLLAVVSGGLGLLVGLLLSAFGFLAALLGDSYLSFETFGTIFTLVCLMPAVYAAAGFVFGIAAAFLVNLALRFGGFNLEAEVMEKPAPAPAPAMAAAPAALPAEAKRKKKTVGTAKTKKKS